MTIDLNAQAKTLREQLAKINKERKAKGLLHSKGVTEDNVKIVYPLLRSGKTTKDATTALVTYRTKGGKKFSKQQASHIVAIVNATLALVNTK